MKTYGDIPIADRILVRELEKLENWFYEHGNTLPVLSIGKGLTCIAHDYYAVWMDEQGERLLKLADVYCPGYFKAPILTHMEKDPDFAKLINNLKQTEALDIMTFMGFQS